MKYKVVLAGGNSLIVDEGQKALLEPYFLNNADGKVIKVGRNTIYTRDIKGIYEVEEETYQAGSDYIREISAQFSRELENYAKQDPKTKAIREMRARVLPGYLKSGGKREDKQMLQAYEDILAYLTENPQLPWCPVEVWWTYVSEKAKEFPRFSNFYLYVIRHENQVREWLRYKGQI